MPGQESLKLLTVIYFYMSKKEHPKIGFRLTKEEKINFLNEREKLGINTWKEFFYHLVDCKRELDQAKEGDEEREDLATELKEELDQARKELDQAKERDDERDKKIEDLEEEIERVNKVRNESVERHNKIHNIYDDQVKRFEKDIDNLKRGRYEKIEIRCPLCNEIYIIETVGHDLYHMLEERRRNPMYCPRCIKIYEADDLFNQGINHRNDALHGSRSVNLDLALKKFQEALTIYKEYGDSFPTNSQKYFYTKRQEADSLHYVGIITRQLFEDDLDKLDESHDFLQDALNIYLELVNKGNKDATLKGNIDGVYKAIKSCEDEINMRAGID